MKELGRADVIKEMTRLCNSHSCRCCPLQQRKEDLGLELSCTDFKLKHPIEVFLVLEKWANEHPEKTILQDFKEKYPKAPLDDVDGTPRSVCPHHLGYGKEENRPCRENPHSCVECWSRPLEEV